MGYIRALERELREMLVDVPEEKAEAIVKFVKEKVYESYQNGRQASEEKGGQAES
jgi:hypothetical protein